MPLFIYVEREYDTYTYFSWVEPKELQWSFLATYVGMSLKPKKKEYFWHPNTEWSASAKTQVFYYRVEPYKHNSYMVIDNHTEI